MIEAIQNYTKKVQTVVSSAVFWVSGLVALLTAIQPVLNDYVPTAGAVVGAILVGLTAVIQTIRTRTPVGKSERGL